ncbi:MAG: Phage baseplate assembly protein [Sphingomonas bacterium]|nr:Phage baseplate assembly protein [Sphingomonas bacterium]
MSASTGAPLDGADHLRQSIADILGTPLGTRIGRRDYGSLLPELIDRPANAATRILLYGATALALLRHEPRLHVSRIGLAPGQQPGAFVLTIAGKRTDVPPQAAAFSATTPVRGLAALSA